MKQVFLLTLVALGLVFPGPQLLAEEASVTDVFMLENKNIRVSLRKDLPAITAYQLKGGNRLLSADITGNGPGISFFKGGDQVVSNWTTLRYTASTASSRIRYTYG